MSLILALLFIVTVNGTRSVYISVICEDQPGGHPFKDTFSFDLSAIVRQRLGFETD